MLEHLIRELSDHPFLYAQMPIVSAIVGWFTNVVALKMMFYPIEFVGPKPPLLGWQGIIPRKAAKMAGIACDTMTQKLISVDEIFQRLDPDRVAQEIERPILAMIDDIVNEVMSEHQPTLWESLPLMVRDQIIRRIQAEAPVVVAEIIGEVRVDVRDMFDLKDMIVTNLVKDKQLLNTIFLEVGRKELRFIALSGAYFGFPFGLIQTLVYVFYQAPWQLPVAGLLVGYLTNWLALQMVFNPKEIWRVGPFAIQGLFLKRQKEVARDYGSLIASSIVTPANIIEAVLKGPRADKLFALIARHVKRTIDEQTGIVRPFVAFTIGSRTYIEMKEAAVARILAHAPHALKSVEGYAGEAMDINNTIVERMALLSPLEFEAMLRPAFKEDEWILISVGALLGLLVGFGQMALVAAGIL
jgi:uncharacterized membrane protein YheB (UPF0754 family)